ncbi:hypothetical protein L1887_17279 [Cichorium endivia]|nr:hypothetical protein L1887_17279 [Cichorium endivia]
MASSNWALVIIEFSILTYLAGLTITHGDSICGNQGNYTQNSAYAKNLDDTLSALPNAPKGDGFYSASSSSTEGNQTSTAYALALCLGEFEYERCLECVRATKDRISRACPDQIKATGWYFDTCMFSYSNSSFDIVDGDDKDVNLFFPSTKIIPTRDSVDETLVNLFKRIWGEAATDRFNKTFYSITASTGPAGYIQATMQCFPNISQTKCNECFDNATNYLQISYDGSDEGVLYYRYSCLLKYAISPVNIEDPSPQTPPTNSPSVPNPGKKRSKVIIPAVVAGAVTLAILSFFIFLKIRRIYTKKGEDEELFEASDDETGEIIYFRLKEIQAATRYFSAANKLGEGGFGPVYWGELSDDFGTARIFGSNQIEASTNRVVGTYGYMAPEYAMEGMFSIKSDVYSFGVLLLEIISGKRNNRFFYEEHDQNLLYYAWMLWNEDKGEQLIDENLCDDCPVDQALKLMRIALLCIEEDPTDRPTMSSVACMLEGEWKSLSEPKPPMSFGQFVTSDDSGFYSSTGSSVQTGKSLEIKGIGHRRL